MRPKTKDWRMSSFSLDKDTIPKLEEIAHYEGVSKADMIDFLVNNWSAGIDPSDKLKQLQTKKELIQKNLSEVEKEISLVIKQISLFNDWNKSKTNRKGEAIRVIGKKLLNKEFEEAERMAKTWQRLCGIPALELLIEARDKILGT